MSGRQAVDFSRVEVHHHAIDARLRNYGTWCNGSGAPQMSPMFRLMPPPPRVRGDIETWGDSVDTLDASKIAKAVIALPVKHRAAINWCYVAPVNPRRACQDIGVSMQGLSDLLTDGRQMLVNRRV